MKQVLLVIFFIIAMAILSWVIFIKYHDAFFVEKNFLKFTGVKEYIIKADYNDNHQSYFETIISNNEKRLLLQKFKFEDDLGKLTKWGECPFITKNPNYFYFIYRTAFGQYGHILMALEKNGNTLMMYEFYGD